MMVISHECTIWWEADKLRSSRLMHETRSIAIGLCRNAQVHDVHAGAVA